MRFKFNMALLYFHFNLKFPVLLPNNIFQNYNYNLYISKGWHFTPHLLTVITVINEITVCDLKLK